MTSQGWPEVALGDVLEVQNGFAFASKQFSPTVGMPLIRIRDLKDSGKNAIRFDGAFDETYLVTGGDLLIGMDGEFVCHQWNGDSALLNQRVCRLQAFSDRINSRFLLHGINRFLKEIEDNTPYTTVKHLSSKTIKNIRFPLPPMDAQKRIVAILDQAFTALDRARAHAEANLADALLLRSLTIESELTSERLGPLESLGSHVELLTGFAFKSAGYSDNPADIRLIRGDNIVQARFRWEGVKRWPVLDRDTYAKYELALNDILIAMDRTWVSAGIKYAIVDEEALPSLLVQRVARLRSKKSVLPSYLGYWIGSSLFEKYVLSIQTGLGVPHVSGTQIENFSVRIPSVNVQRAVVQKLDLISERCTQAAEAYEEQLADLATLRQSLLQQAFSGQLT